jgi:predicted ATPase
LRIKVANFGPVKKAEIELKPLLIFIGPNNSGKSLIAALLYAILLSGTRATSKVGAERIWRLTQHLRSQDPGVVEELGYMRAIIDNEGRTLGADDIPGSFQSFVEDLLEGSLREYMRIVSVEIARACGASTAELRRVAGKRTLSATISIRSQDPSWGVAVRFRGVRTEEDIDVQPRFSEVWNTMSAGDWRWLSSQLLNNFPAAFSIVLDRLLFGEYPENVKYLPAARSGILQARRAIAGSLVRNSSLAGIENIQVPALGGVVADFLGELIETSSSATGFFSAEADRLESEILHGRISVLNEGAPTSEIIYQTDNAKYPLGRTSSMVSELAPVVLSLRHRLSPGDFLLIEEPEAHLHPAAQVAFAKCIVRLVNRGLRIGITTHSEFFLQQLNNAIMAGSADGTDKLSEQLDASSVGAYFFEPTDSGTSVVGLPVDPKEGIPEASFSSVSEQLYNEAVYLDRSLRA